LRACDVWLTGGGLPGLKKNRIFFTWIREFLENELPPL